MNQVRVGGHQTYGGILGLAKAIDRKVTRIGFLYKCPFCKERYCSYKKGLVGHVNQMHIFMKDGNTFLLLDNIVHKHKVIKQKINGGDINEHRYKTTTKPKETQTQTNN